MADDVALVSPSRVDVVLRGQVLLPRSRTVKMGEHGVDLVRLAELHPRKEMRVRHTSSSTGCIWWEDVDDSRC
jgi:hypothetical protein